jgi:DNA-directed RNA polymerase subunit RPC12/RpoP
VDRIEELPEGEEFEEKEFPPEEGEGDEIFACPRCGAKIYADAVRCPSCGDYVTPGAAPARPRERVPWWLWLGLLLAGAVIVGLVFGG